MNAKRLLFGEPSSHDASEFYWQIVWLMTVGIAVSYGAYLFFGSLISGTERPPAMQISAVDVVRAGEHRISGIVPVPSACHQLAVEPRKLSASSYGLVFRTWQEPSQNCSREHVTKAFHTVVFAPSVGITFSAVLDGQPVSLKLVPHYE